jgi:ubiquinone/menaquinone biosynthesis C-methylase UbiE
METCLRSVREQNLDSIEIIVVAQEDCLRAREIAERYGAAFIACSSRKTVARNTGAKVAKGDYLLFLDADMRLTREVVKASVDACLGGFDAVIIPEKVEPRNFLTACKAFEKELYENSAVVEAPRFMTARAVKLVGGFDETFDAIDEYTLHARVRSAGLKIARISAPIWVAEDLSLKQALENKLARGREFSRFRRRYPFDAKMRFSMRSRVDFYRARLRRMIDRRSVATPMLLLKMLEFIFFCLGRVVGNTPNNDPRKQIIWKFDREACFYEYQMYRKDLGSSYVDTIEKGTVVHLLSTHTSWSSKTGQVVLDMGAGCGRWSKEITKRGACAIALDISAKMARESQRRVNQETFASIVADMGYLPIRTASADMVLSIRSIKYSMDWERVFHEVSCALKAQGVAILEISLRSPQLRLLAFAAPLLRKVRFLKAHAEYLAHVKLSGCAEFLGLLEASGLVPINFEYLFVLPHLVFAKARTRAMLNAMISADYQLSRILPRHVFSRSFVAVCKKVGVMRDMQPSQQCGPPRAPSSP